MATGSGDDDPRGASLPARSLDPMEVEAEPMEPLLQPSLYSMQGLPMSALRNYGLIPRPTTFEVKVRRELRAATSPRHTSSCKWAVPRLIDVLG